MSFSLEYPSRDLLLVVLVSSGIVAFLGWKVLSYLPYQYQQKSTRAIYAPSKSMGKYDCATSPSVLIFALPDFQWENTEPLQLRPYKAKLHLTMAIEKSSASEFLQMDKTYLERILLRRSIMDKNAEIVLGGDIACQTAVEEFYIWLFGTYLPTRFPKMFRHSGKTVLNMVVNERIELTPPTSTVEALRIIGSHIDDDVLFLLPSPDGDGYSLRGFVTCFPSGFNTKNKLFMKLRDIHSPVPGYKEKLEMSMDRFFARLETGTYVKRAIWTITTTNNPFTPFGTHLYDGEIAIPEVVDISQANLRVERQVLHKLPESKAIVFSFETYLYPITTLKEEGAGQELADAIDGLRTGSVPAMHFYKRAAVWGDAIQAYLRS